MTVGIGGTGPYGRIRQLRNDISNFNYELRLIEQGMRRPIGKKRLEELIESHRREIREIQGAQKTKKKE